jgi:hypothetical protein
MNVSLHLLVPLRVRQRRRPVPHLYFYRGDAVTGLLSASRPEMVPEEAAEMQPDCG